MIHVLVWNEFKHERSKENVKAIYPEGIHQCIADFLGKEKDIRVKTATLDQKNCGITQKLLDWADVLIWWGHMAHDKVPDEIAYMIKDAVNNGMGFIALHSAHHSKPFRYLMGTSCNLTWRETGDNELLWVTDPSHPIVKGIDRFFKLEGEETYGEPFVVPEPDKLLLIGNFSGREVMRSGCLWQRGNGKIFYFQPGHETFPTYHDPNVQKIIINAVRYLKPIYREPITCPHTHFYDDPEGYVRKKN